MHTPHKNVFKIYTKQKIDNGIGGFIEEDVKLFSIKGYLDWYTGQESDAYNAVLQDTTHILLTDYRNDISTDYFVVDEASNRYDIILVDDPVTLNHHLEIYLKFIGEYNVK